MQLSITITDANGNGRQIAESDNLNDGLAKFDTIDREVIRAEFDDKNEFHPASETVEKYLWLKSDKIGHQYNDDPVLLAVESYMA